MLIHESPCAVTTQITIFVMQGTAGADNRN
jgi:hypothetical protein